MGVRTVDHVCPREDPAKKRMWFIELTAWTAWRKGRWHNTKGRQVEHCGDRIGEHQDSLRQRKETPGIELSPML